MFKASRTALLIIGMLMSAASLADDENASNADSEPLPGVILSVQTLLSQSKYSPRWQLFHSVEPMPYSENWTRPIADIEFQDGNALARISMLRSLSLLTLVETGQTRLFLGVNKDGLVGLHFNALPRYGDDRHLDLVRMPYLEEIEPEQALTSVSY